MQDAGLQVFSKSFWGDFWLVYKNSHIVMSCFLVHPDRHFTATKRFWLLIVSLFMAWGLSAILAPTTVRTLMFGCDIDEIIETASQDIDEAPDVGIRRADQADECYEDIPIEVQVILAAASCLLQLGYDSFAEVVIKCACFQKGCGECIRICCEGIGGIIFSILAFVGTIFLLAGVLITMLLNGDVVSNIIVHGAGGAPRQARVLPRGQELEGTGRRAQARVHDTSWPRGRARTARGVPRPRAQLLAAGQALVQREQGRVKSDARPRQN